MLFFHISGTFRIDSRLVDLFCAEFLMDREGCRQKSSYSVGLYLEGRNELGGMKLDGVQDVLLV